MKTTTPSAPTKKHSFDQPIIKKGAIFIPSASVGDMIILEDIGSPFITGSTFKIKDLLEALFILTQKDKAPVRAAIKSGTFHEEVIAWADPLAPNYLEKLAPRIVKALEDSLSQPVKDSKS